MKNFVLFLFLLPVIAAAQVTHKVEAKETLYSLARKYNVHPRELAAYNNIPVETPLALGQIIKIPAKTTMAPLPPASEPVPATSKPVKETPVVNKQPVVPNEKSVPVYHKVGKKETLYHISKLYPGITIADIKKWNNLSGDALSEGSDLIVGYSNKGSNVPEKKDVVVPDKPSTPVAKVPEPEKIAPEKTVVTDPPKQEEQKSVTGKNFNGGVFRNQYNDQASTKKQVAEEKGKAGIFKSTSGWEDGKYYCLTNTAPAGTIVKVTNNATQRSIYAKVLDLIPDLKQNAGLIIRLSNASAEELGATENFDCVINY